MQIVNHFRDSETGVHFTTWEDSGRYACTQDRDGAAHEPVNGCTLSTFKIAQEIALGDYWADRNLDQD